jgi:SAM-dependent methyltransferase
MLYLYCMPNNFRDIQDMPGVAPAHTQDQMEMTRTKARLWGEENTAGTGPVSSTNFANPTANVAKMGIDPGMKVVDFGAGSGAYTIAAARFVGQSGKVYAVDVQKELLTRIKNNATKEGMDWVEIVWGDFEKSGGSRIKDKSVDMVIMSNVLFQLDHAPGAFAEAQRILKPNGKLAVIDWTDSFGGMGPEPSRVVTQEKAINFANAPGFSLIRDFSAGAHHYGILLKTDR